MTAEQFASLLAILSFLAFFLMVVGLFKPTWVIRRPSLRTRKGVLLVWGVLWLCIGTVSTMITNYAVSDEPTTESATALHKLYVKVDTANIRQCPLLTCAVVDTFGRNSWVTTSADSLAEAPEWIEVTYDADPASGEQTLTGYINKVTLSDEPVSASDDSRSQPPEGRGSSSVGGITIGPWGDIETIVGESYEFYFCEPPSAISGATCGGLADKATNPRGGTPPYSFVKKSGFLPQGMTLELNGIFRGVPTVVGAYNFTLCAKDLHGGEGCQNLLVVVKKAETSPTPSVLPPSQPTGVRSYVVSFSAEGDAIDDFVIGTVTYHAVFRGGPVAVADVPANGGKVKFGIPFTVTVALVAPPKSPHPVCVGNYPGYSATETFTGTVPGSLLVDPRTGRLKFSFEEISDHVSDYDNMIGGNFTSNCYLNPGYWRHGAWGIIRNPLDLGAAFPYVDANSRTVEVGGGAIEGRWKAGSPQSTGQATGGSATIIITPAE